MAKKSKKDVPPRTPKQKKGHRQQPQEDEYSHTEGEASMPFHHLHRSYQFSPESRSPSSPSKGNSKYDSNYGSKHDTTRPLNDAQLHHLSMQHASAAAFQLTSGGAGKNGGLVDPDLQIAQQYMDLGKSLKQRGDFRGSILEMQKALEIRKNVVGKEHPDTASTYYQLGITYCQAQDYNSAFTELKRALTLGRICWGRNHEDTACTYYQLGICLNAQGDFPKGHRELKKALAIFEVVLGRDHEATARTWHHMGDAQAGMGLQDQAVCHYAQALMIQTSRLGRHNPQTVETFRKLNHHMRLPNE